MRRIPSWRVVLSVAFIAVGLLAAGAYFAVDYSLANVSDPFSSETAGLAEATSTDVVELGNGATFELRAGMVRKRIDNALVRMLAYNGSIPGPTLRVSKGSEATVRVTNATDLETTVHWHGLRLDNQFDGVAHKTQQPIPVGGSFTYQLRFPDEGVFWYHPHVREDYGQEMGLYGNILVAPNAPDFWPPVNREITLALDDLLLERGKVAPFSRSHPNRSAMGRFGNVMLANGQSGYALEASQGEVVRLYLTNTANTRVFNVRIPGARMKLLGADNGRYEREVFVDEVLLSPSERATVDVLFERAGRLRIEHRTPERSYDLGTVSVGEGLVARSFAGEFSSLRPNRELESERAGLAGQLGRAPDKTLVLVGDLVNNIVGDLLGGGRPGGQPVGQHGGHGGGGDQRGGIEWEDSMAWLNARTSKKNMFWKLIDRETGGENHDISWSFELGDRVKVRVMNEVQSDHPMQHPIHFHGQRFLVLGRDGAANANLAWKDTVLVRTGETVDLLVEIANPGVWMAHCHIAEHLESGMYFNFQVGGAGDFTHPGATD